MHSSSRPVTTEDTMLKNILANPSLEGAYIEQGAPELKVAPAWRLAFRHGEPAPDGPQDSEHFCGQPEYKRISRKDFPDRVHAGDAAQCAFVRWRVMDACILQRVPVPVGRLLTLRATVHAWCSDLDDPTRCDGEFYFRLGLDLMGDVNPFNPLKGPALVWSDWEQATPDYQQIQLQAEAKHPYATAIIRFWNRYRKAHNDAYIDDTALLVDQDDTLPIGDHYTTSIEWAQIFRAAADALDPPDSHP